MQPIHHADSFPPSILPLFVLSELVMNFTDFLGFFGKRPAAVVLTKCDKLVNLRTSKGIRCGYSLELSGCLEENLYSWSRAFIIIPQDLEGSLDKVIYLVPIHMKKSVHISSLTLVPVTSDSREDRKTPDIGLGTTSHVVQRTKAGSPFYVLPFNVYNSQIKKSVCLVETIVTYKWVCYFRRTLYSVYISSF